MCDDCTKQWASMSEEQKYDAADHVRHVQSSVVAALRDVGEDPVNIYAACAFVARYHEAQFDAPIRAIAGEMVDRLMVRFEAQLAKQGKRLEPAGHSTMSFGPVEDRPSAEPREVDISALPEEAREAVADLVAKAAEAGMTVSFPDGAELRPRSARPPRERPAFVRRAPRSRRS